MPVTHLRTSDIARELGVHVNTIRLYESQGYLPKIPRGTNGYRQYSVFHLEFARLARITLHWPYLVEYKASLEMLVKYAVQQNYEMAMELAFQYLAMIRIERTHAESALAFLERWVAGYIRETVSNTMHISQAAHYLNVTVDMLRNWERNGLIQVPRDPSNGYRLYGTSELGRLRVIRILVQSGHSLMAVLKMLHQFDNGQTDNLSDALDLPLDESANELIEVVADRWLVSLYDLEDRAQAIIQQLSYLIEMHYT